MGKHNEEILIVDDTPASLKLLSELLLSEGYQVRPANSGELALVSIQSKLPQMILLDIRMPGIDGYEVCRRLKADNATKDIPVIFISALDAVKDRIKGFECGGIDFITKPFQREEVLARVRNHLELFSTRCDLEERTLELADTNKSLADANRQLQQLDRLKSMFVASVSHELRTPLNSIIGFSDVMAQGMTGELNEKQLDYTKRINHAGQHLLALISDIIDIFKIESGRVETFPSEFELGDVIKEAVQSVQPMLNEKGLDLHLNLPADVSLSTDRRRLTQCLLNYLSNAIKFTEKGSVTISAIASTDKVEITVTDTGIGIAAEDMGRLFEAFERLDSHLQIKAGGTGLGLYLTREITRNLLLGDVFVECTPDKGCQFGLRIPRVTQRQVPEQVGAA